MVKDCILIIAYKRPDYTRQLLEALASQPTIKNYHVHFQIDPGFSEVQDLAYQFNATDKTVNVNPSRLDCNLNVYYGLKNAFKLADFVMVFEDDCIPAPDCLKWMEWAKTKMDWDSRAINAFHKDETNTPGQFMESYKCPHWTAWVWGTSKEHWVEIEKIFLHEVPSDSSNSWDVVLHNSYFKHGTVIKPKLSRARNIGAENGRYNPSAEWHKQNMWIDQWSGSVPEETLSGDYALDLSYKKDLVCFCGGRYEYSTFDKYLKCVECGTYHSPNHADPTKYYDAAYWSSVKGNSTLLEQWYNLTSSWFKGIVPRVDFWMDIIMTSVNVGKRSLEIGCAPGVMMQRLFNVGWDVYGVDAHPYTINMTQELSKIDRSHFYTGLWPEVADKIDGKFGLIVCTDVFEHTPDPKKFLQAMYDKLEDGGYLFIQTPVILKGRDENAPFGDLTSGIFEPKQHIYLYNDEGFIYLLSNKFNVVRSKVWHPGHECFLLQKI